MSVRKKNIRRKNHTRAVGAAMAAAAIMAAIPTAVQAHADPSAAPEEPAAPTTAALPVPVMTNLPDPQGPDCGSYRDRVPAGAGSFVGMASQSASEAIASNPDLSTFSAALSGGLNSEVDIVDVLDGGPYVVFAPTDDAFATLEPGALDALKADPAKLISTLFYHMVLGYLGPDDVHGLMTTQDGRQIDVTGKGGDIKINNTAKVVCGGITTRGASLYMINTVLDPDAAPTPPTPSGAATPAEPADAAESTGTEPIEPTQPDM